MGVSIEPFIAKEQLVYIDLYSQAWDWLPSDIPFTEETS